MFEVIAFSALLFASATDGPENPPGDRTIYMRCASDRAAGLASTAASADSIAESAVQECAPLLDAGLASMFTGGSERERNTRRAFRDALLERMHDAAVRRIERVRSGG